MAPLDILDRSLGIIDPVSGHEPSREQREKLRRWRMVVGTAILAGAFHVAWACGLLPNFSGFAIAADTESKIAVVRKEIAQQVTDLEHRVVRIERKMDSSLKLQIESRIRDLTHERCTARTQRTIDRLEAEIDSLQDDHHTITGERYPLRPCAELVP